MKQCQTCKQFSSDRARRCGVCGQELEVEETHPEVLGEDWKQGALWFYWIAGLSMANSILAVLGLHLFFVIGLQAGAFLQGFLASFLGVVMPNLSFEPMLIPVLVVEGVIAFAIAAFGWAASRGSKAAFLVGASLYAVDAGFCLVVRDYLSFAIHAVALGFILRGFKALRLRRKRQVAVESAPAVRPPAFAGALVTFAAMILVPVQLLMAGTFYLSEGRAMAITEWHLLTIAPEDFTDADRARLSRAIAAVDHRFQGDGGRIPLEEAARMNQGLADLLDRPPGQLATREEMLAAIELLEAVGRLSAPPDQGIVEAAIRVDAPARP